MRRRLGDLRAAEPQWQFGSAMNDMLGADTAPIRPPALPAPPIDEPEAEAEAEVTPAAEDVELAGVTDASAESEAPMLVGLAEDDPMRSALDAEQAMEQVEDQARRLRELAAEALDEQDEPDEPGSADAAVDDRPDTAGSPAMPSMEFVTDAEQRYQEHAGADPSGGSEDLPEDELAAALESMLQGPDSEAGVPDTEAVSEVVDEGVGVAGESAVGEDPAEELDRTLEGMIDEGLRADLDPPAEVAESILEPAAAVEDHPSDSSEADPEAGLEADPEADSAMPVPGMDFVGDAADLFEDPADAAPGEIVDEPAAARPRSRRASLKTVRGALAAKAATLEPLKKALGDVGLDGVDEASLSRDQMKALMVDLDRQLADGVETLLESSYDAVADILDLVFEESEEPPEEESERLEEPEDETRPGARRREERPSREAAPSEAGDRSVTTGDEQLDEAGEMAAIDDLDVEFDEVDLDEPGAGSAASTPRPAAAARGRTGRISPPRPAGPGLRERLVVAMREFRGDFSGTGARLVHGAMAAMSRPLDHVPPDWRTTVDWIAISLAFWVPIVWLLVAFVL